MKKRLFVRRVLSVAVALASTYAIAEQNEVEQIVVYGEKQERSLQDTAASVAVITSEDLEALPVFNIQDVFSRTANVASRNPGDQRTDFTIRGVRSDGTTGEGAGYTASVILDGATLGAEALNYGGLGVWDLAQIEIFRGPQGTLQGRNTLMGAIVAKTKDPTFEPEGQAQVQVGDNNTYRTSFAYSDALSDTVAARISVDKFKSDGAISNSTRGTEDHAYSDREEIRAKVVWEASDDLNVKFTLSHVNNDVGASNRVRYDDPFSFEALSDIQDYNETSSDMAVVEAAYNLSDSLTLTSISSYTDDNYERYDDYDSSAAEGNFINQNYAGRGWAQEFRFNFQRDNFSAVAGIYAAESKRKTYYDVRSLFTTATFRETAVSAYLVTEPFASLFSALSGGDPAVAEVLAGTVYDTYMPASIDLTNLSDNQNDTQNFAVFGEGTWDLDPWSLTFGLRYDYESLENSARVVSSAVPVGSVDAVTDIGPALGAGGPIGVTQADVVYGTLAALVSTSPASINDVSYDAILPKGVVTYRWTDDLSTSFLVQKGYRAGGVSVVQQTGEAVQFDPEFTWNYELSLRSQWLDQRLTLNANIYHIDWTDQQVSFSPTGGQFDRYTANAGKSVLQGAEVEVSYLLNEQMELFGSLGYSQTEFKEFTTSAGADLAGNAFRQAPRVTGNLGVNYTSGRLQATVDMTFQDRSYNDNENTRQSDAFAVFNGRIAYSVGQNWTVSAWATNLFNKEYVTSLVQQNSAYLQVQDTISVGSPRSVGAAVNYQF